MYRNVYFSLSILGGPWRVCCEVCWCVGNIEFPSLFKNMLRINFSSKGEELMIFFLCDTRFLRDAEGGEGGVCRYQTTFFSPSSFPFFFPLSVITAVMNEKHSFNLGNEFAHFYKVGGSTLCACVCVYWVISVRQKRLILSLPKVFLLTWGWVNVFIFFPLLILDSVGLIN